MKRVLVAVMLSGIVLVALPQGASAARFPSAAEKRAIAHDWAPGTRSSCLVVLVSDISSKWASLTWGPERQGETARQYIRRCPMAGNGLAMLNKRDGKWRYIADAGSSGRGPCPLSKVPSRVAADLKACFAPERQCESPDLFGDLYAPSTTSCEVALEAAIRYEAENDSTATVAPLRITATDPKDGRRYSFDCVPEGTDEDRVGCDSRRHRFSIRY